MCTLQKARGEGVREEERVSNECGERLGVIAVIENDDVCSSTVIETRRCAMSAGALTVRAQRGGKKRGRGAAPLGPFLPHRLSSIDGSVDEA